MASGSQGVLLLLSVPLVGSRQLWIRLLRRGPNQLPLHRKCVLLPNGSYVDGLQLCRESAHPKTPMGFDQSAQLHGPVLAGEVCEG